MISLMIKAIIFDLFGVLTSDGLDEFAINHLSNDQAKIEQANILVDELNIGKYSYENWVEKMAELAGVSVATVDEYMDEHRPNSRLIDFIRKELRLKYKLGVLSNSGGDWFYEIFNKDDQALFDDVVLSYKTGFIKPQPEIYQLSLKNLGVDANQSVFVDDNIRYCQAANDLGIHSVHYLDFQQTKLDLEKLLEI